MSFISGHTFSQKKNLNLRGDGLDGALPGLLRLHNGTTNPALGAADYALYVLNGNLIFEAAQSESTLGAAGAVANFSLDDAYDDGRVITVDSGAVTLNVSNASAGLALSKTDTGAGTLFAATNAGSGLDLDVENTNQADATGIIAQFHYNAAAPADDDIPLELRINADDDGGTETTLSTVRWYQRDVTAATDDAEFYMSLMVAGTERQVLQIDTDSVEIGNGNAAAVLSSSGAFDLTLETNRGTNSGTITITDGVNGNIQIAPDGTGILDLNSGFDIDAASTETCTITVVGTTGDGLYIDTSTITSGDVVAIDHTVSGTLDGGNLLNLLVDSSSVWRVGETGNMTILGSAGTNVVTVSNGDLVVSDGSLTMTDADDAASLSITNNTATTANVFLFTGSGVFTGTGTTAFFRVTQSGATSGDVVNIQADGLTEGTALRLGSTGTMVTTGAMLEIVADSATTAAGLIRLTADALTTGIGALLASTSVNLAAGQLLNIDHTASGTIVAKTGQLIDIVSSRDNTAAAAISDDYDALSIIRTNINTNAGGTLNAAGSCLRLENVGTQTAGTLADTVIGLEIVMTGGATQDGNGLSITHTGTTAGQAIDVIASQTTGTVALLTMNSLTTTGVGLSLTNTGTGMTTGSVLRVASGTTGAVATNGVISLFATGAFTSTAVTDGFVRVNANSTLSGTAVAINGNSFTTGVGLYIGDTGTGMTSGSLIRVSSGSTGAVATNGIVNFVATAAHTSTAGVGFVNVSDATATGNAVSVFANSLTTGTGLLVSSSGTITSAGEGLVNIVGTGITTGFGLKIDLTEGTLTTGLYVNLYDDTAGASVLTIGEDGATTIAGSAALTAALTLTAGDILVSDGLIRGSVNAGVTAAVGSAQGDEPITNMITEISVCANAGDAVTLPSAAAGQMVIITNHGAQAADVFPASGDAINEGAANTATSLAVNETFICVSYDATNWEVVQLARNS